MKWLPEHDDILIRMSAEGYFAGDIAVKLYETHGFTVTRNAVIGRAHRKGIVFLNSPSHQAVGKALGPVRPRKPRVPKPPKPIKPPKPTWLDGAGDLRQEDSIHAVSLLEARRHQCRWPINGRAPEILFCGAPAEEKHSYCPRHSAAARL